MMDKIVIIDSSKCTGCRVCEVVCSATKYGVVDPSRARIAVVKWESLCLDTPILCQQCEQAPCAAVCPTKALARDEAMGRVTIDYDRCIGCRFCVAVCPFGAMGIDPIEKKVIKCDQCDGDPMCVKFCETKALEYVDANVAARARKRQAAERLSELIQRHAG